MDQIRRLNDSLSNKQKISIGLAAVAIAGAVFWFSQWQRERNLHPLYTQLSPEDAAVVVQKLREGNTEYKLSENGSTILVNSTKIAELRLELAAAGIPKSGRIGFELFDKTNFGMTEFTEHVNFRRALEGELERSVMSLAEVETARVHLTFPKESVFLDSREAAKASVLVKLRVGAKMSPANVMAVTHLVSSAVEGLNPSAVSVLDMRGNLLSRNRPRGEADASAENEAAIEYQQKLEKELVTKVNATLEPLLGAERFRAAASVDCDLTSGEQSEETFDPTKSVMTSQQRTEDGAMASYAGGVPGTASNLPRPTPKSAGGEGGGVSRRTEQISYQTSRLMRRIKLPQGTVKRLSVAVLLDQDVKWDGVGPTAKRSLIPVPPEKLKSIHDLVAAAIGLSAQRGDQLTVDSLPFESTLNSEPPAAPVVAKPQRPMVQRIKEKDPEALQIVGGIAGGVLLLVIIAGMKLKGSKKKGTKASKKGEIEVKELPAAVHAAEAHLDPTKAVAAAEGAEGPTFAEALSAPQPEPNTYLEALTQAETNQKKQLGPTRMDTITTDLRESATKDSELYASIMRGWLAEDQ